MYNIGVFISHSWAYTGHYETLAGWIFDEPWSVASQPINFVNFSIPEDDPIHNANNQNELYAAILAEIAKSHVLICPTGMYSSHSKWIGNELKGAQYLGVKVLAVNPWGQERKSSVVVAHADASVGWSKNSVINGIWNLYNHGG